MNKVLGLLLLTILFSCGSNPENSKLKYSKIEVSELSEQDMFTYAKVKTFADKQKETKTISNPYFLKGVDAFKNKKDIDSAIFYFNQSIFTNPSNVAYYELGNVLLEKKHYHKAIYAYEMAEKLGYEPFSKVLYNIACAHSLLGDTDLAGQYLEFALQAGYSNLDNINKDKDLANLRYQQYIFERHFKKGMKGMSNAENLFWLQFKRKFNKMNFPLKLNEKLDILLINEETLISYDFEKYIAEMRDDKFSREVSKGFYYLAEIQETKDFVALVYVVKDEFMGDDAPLIFRLATYSHSGVLLDKKEIAGRSDFMQNLKSATVNKDKSILITHFETKYEKDLEEFGLYENKMISKKKLFSETYKINSKGQIVKEEAPALSSAN